MIGYKTRASELRPSSRIFACPRANWLGLSLFGRKGSHYDFAAIDIGQLKEKAKELEDMQKGMKKKKVNPKVINMIDR